MWSFLLSLANILIKWIYSSSLANQANMYLVFCRCCCSYSGFSRFSLFESRYEISVKRWFQMSRVLISGKCCRNFENGRRFLGNIKYKEHQKLIIHIHSYVCTYIRMWDIYIYTSMEAFNFEWIVKWEFTSTWISKEVQIFTFNTNKR